MVLQLKRPCLCSVSALPVTVIVFFISNAKSWETAMGRKRFDFLRGITRKTNAIDIPVAEEETVESVPDAYKVVLIGDRAVGKSRWVSDTPSIV